MSARLTWLLALSVCALAACAGARPVADAPEDAGARAPSGAQLLEMADLLAQRGDYVRAGQYLSAAQAHGVPDRELVGRLLRLDAAAGQYRLAIEHAETYLRSHPAELGVRECLAAFYAAIGAAVDAVREYERVLRERPSDPELHFALATLLREAGSERARMDAHYRAYIALAPDGQHVDEARAELFEELP
jgi:tetratricopeptide (TPR) repeat protein